MSVEDRINIHHEAVATDFAETLLRIKLIPKSHSKGVYTLKLDASIGIAERLKEDGVQFSEHDFSRAIYGSINKTPLKQVGYGMLNATLPSVVANELTPWEAMYAYAGIWELKATDDPDPIFKRDVINHIPLYRLVHDIVIKGINRIKYTHNTAVGGEYNNQMEMAPHEAEIRQRLLQPTVYDVRVLKKMNLLQGKLF